jgi:predicted ATPase
MMSVPFLDSISTPANLNGSFPYNIPLFKKGIDIKLKTPITFIVGENGSGKSTLLEAIAIKCNYNVAGGNKNHMYEHNATESLLWHNMILSWIKKPYDGFFLRAESFYSFATYLDRIAKESPSVYSGYGGKSLHHQSHGESFLSLFSNKFDSGFFILDEPEAALSPMRQLSLMSILHELESNGQVQFIIATHSPMLLCYPGATILTIEGDEFLETKYEDTEHYQLTTSFLSNPDLYFNQLFKK